MRFILALVSLSFFGWLGFTTAFGTLPSASRINGLNWLLDFLLPSVGYGLSGALMLSVGIALAWVLVGRRRRA